MKEERPGEKDDIGTAAILTRCVFQVQTCADMSGKQGRQSLARKCSCRKFEFAPAREISADLTAADLPEDLLRIELLEQYLVAFVLTLVRPADGPDDHRSQS